MKILLYICGVISAGVGIYELFCLSKSNLAIVIALLAFILAINSIALAKKEK